MRLFAHDSTSDVLHSVAARSLADDAGAKPYILRALTDLFVMRPVHTRDEIHQFEEIAHRLLNEASRSEVDHAAEALCHHPDAPAEVLDRLASRGALKLLAECRRLSTQVLQNAASLGPTTAAVAVARRGDLDAATIALLAARPEIDVLRALVANDMAPLTTERLPALAERARGDAELAGALVARLPHRPETLPLFLAASPRSRKVMIARAVESAGAEHPAAQALEHRNMNALRRIEAIVAENAKADFIGAFAEACHCGPAQARAIVEDATGEALALALRAIGCDLALAGAALDMLGRGAEKHLLARLMQDTPMNAARRILEAIVTRAPRARHVTMLDQTARDSAGRAMPNDARTAPHRSADSRLQA